jgi:signal transduction histidine kinase
MFAMRALAAYRTTSDPEPADADIERRAFDEQVTMLYERGLVALLANLLNALVLVAALWRLVPHERALGWLAAMYAIVAVRLERWRAHRRASRSPYDARRWFRVWTYGTAITGAAWGAAGVLLFPRASLGGRYLLLFVIGGMVAGASASMSSLTRAFLAFAVPALAAPVGRLLIENDPSLTVAAALLVIFGTGMTAVAKSGESSLLQALRLRARNELLLEDLTAARDALTRLNAELEQRVAARTQELERAIEDRDRFVSVVSHELRTPLTSMVLNVESLKRCLDAGTPDRAQMSPLVAAVMRQLDRMRHLVADLLDVSRLSAGRMLYRKEPVALEEVVEASLENVAPQMASSGASFEVKLEEGLRGEWDRYRIEQVLTNLLSNALRYGAPPFSLTAARAGTRARIVVRDGGAGIPAERMPRLFEPFEAIDAGRGHPGVGLGLYIAAQLVRAHEGTIRAESEPGRGTEFVVELPLLAPGETGRPS